jgi:uncharacterized protein with von Willebrand factor type A (vWA) domain
MAAAGSAQAKQVLYNLASLKPSTAFHFSAAGAKPRGAHARAQENLGKSSSAKKSAGALEDAYQEAIRGGKHARFAKDMAQKPKAEIKRGIKSLEKQIELHKDKIQNPEKHYHEFRKLDLREEEANSKVRWPKEISNFREQKQILESILKRHI